jgi:hypothetical protein
MIQFFRNIRQKLLVENKLSRYMLYAIGEIALVMIGILLALQVNKWNEERTYQKERDYLLAELITEFESNFEELQKTQRINKFIIAKNDSTIMALKKLNFPGDEIVLSNILAESRILNLATFNPSDGLINSMLNTSNLEHVKDKTLRRNLLNWSGYVNDLKENENESWDDRAPMADYLARISVFKYEQELEGNVHFESTVSLNPLELRNKLIHSRKLKNYVVEETERLVQKMQDIIQQLKQEIEE